MAKETKITKQQLDTLIGAELVVPVDSGKRKELARILDTELYRATRLEDSVRIRKFNKAIKELANVQNDNLVFARYQHPQGLPLLLSQSNDETEPMNRGYVFTPGNEDFVLDLGRTITVSSDDSTEQKYSFEHGEIFATSEKAAKNWKFDLKKTLLAETLDKLDNEDLSNEESMELYKESLDLLKQCNDEIEDSGFSDEEKKEKRDSIEQYVEVISVWTGKFVELDAKTIAERRKGKRGRIPFSAPFSGQYELQFKEEKMIKDIEIEIRSKSSIVFDCVMGSWEGEDATMDDVVVCKKVVPTSEYLFEVELVFYNGIKKFVVPEKDDNGILLRNEDGTIKEKVLVEKTPLMDCRIFAYESAIDIEETYKFDVETLSVLENIIVDGNSLIALSDDGRVFLHSLNTFFEAEEFEFAKNFVLENKKENGVKKGDVTKIVSFAEFSQFCSKRAIPKNKFEAKKMKVACN